MPTKDEIWIEYKRENTKYIMLFLYRHPINNKKQIKLFKDQLETSINKNSK